MVFSTACHQPPRLRAVWCSQNALMFGRSLRPFAVTRLTLMANRQNQYHVVGRQPPIFGDVPVAAAGQHYFSAAVLGGAAEQGMVTEHLECAPNTNDLAPGAYGIFGRDEIEQPL
jgi:hypothetical protein